MRGRHVGKASNGDGANNPTRLGLTQLLLNKTRREPVVVQLTPVPEGNAAEPVEA